MPHQLDDRAALDCWRHEFRVPGCVQAGEGDELTLIALDAPDALEQLRGLPRIVYEVSARRSTRRSISSGRRLEAIVAVIADDAPPPAPLPRVPPPSETSSDDGGWHTWKIFGAADRADRVLFGAVAPTIAMCAGRRPRRLVLPALRRQPGRRDDPRRASTPATILAARFAARLDEALAPARAAGDLVSIERAAYHREVGRDGADAIDAVERVFESDIPGRRARRRAARRRRGRSARIPRRQLRGPRRRRRPRRHRAPRPRRTPPPGPRHRTRRGARR